MNVLYAKKTKVKKHGVRGGWKMTKSKKYGSDSAYQQLYIIK